MGRHFSVDSPAALAGEEADEVPGTPPDAAPHPRRTGLSWVDLLIVAGFVAVAVWVQANLLVDVDHRISAALPADHVWFTWLLEHGAYSIRHLTNPLFSHQQNAPLGVNMMANTSMLGITLPLAPVTWWLGPHGGYLVMIVLGLAGTATSSYWVLSRHLVASRAGAALAGGFLGFAPGFVHHANGQPNFTMNVLVPVLVWRMFALARSPRPVRHGLLLGLLVAYQVFINEEILLDVTAGALVALVAYGVQRRSEVRRMLGRLLLGGGVAALLAGALLAYPLWFQFHGPQSYRSGSLPWSDWGEDLTAFVTFSKYSLASATNVWEAPIGVIEQTTWFGWPLFLTAVAAAVTLWRWRNVIARTATVTALIFAVLSLGPRLTVNAGATRFRLPWALVGTHTPLLSLIMPTRLAVVVVGAVGVLLALMWDALSAAARAVAPAGRGLSVWAHGALCVAVATVFPVPLPATDAPPVPRFISSGDWRSYLPAGRTLVPVPLPDRFGGLASFAWSVAGRQEFPVPAGYFLGPDADGEVMFGAPPRPTSILFAQVTTTGWVPDVTPVMRAAVQDDLAYWRTGLVVLGGGGHEQEALTLLSELLGTAQRVDDVWLWQLFPR